jgi:hypothetical protein
MNNDQPESNKLESPTLMTSGTRLFKYHGNWQREAFQCPRCGWTGSVTGLDLDDPCGGTASIQCPKCYRRIGVVVFPNLADTEEAAAQGNEEAIKALPGMQDRIKRFAARHEKFREGETQESRPTAGPLEGASLEFLWDIADAGGDTYQIIRLGDAEVWRELAYFDNIPRFHEVKEFLKNRYETRFKSLRPTEGSREWLCGDNAGKLDRLSYR